MCKVGCFGMGDALLKVRRVSCQLSRAARRLAAQLSRIRAHRECPRPLFPQFRTNKTFSVRRKTMSKRELGKLASVVDVDAPRAKRRKEAPPQDEKKPDADMDVDAGGAANVKREQEDPAKLEQVKEQGLRLWQTVKDAVDKECVTDLRLCVVCLLTLIIHDLPSGRSLSVDFLRLPNRRTYPDYYTIIKKPIALDKIRAHLDAGQYSSLIAVKNDLEQCFRNAKRYNLKDSQIFNDAKFLHVCLVFVCILPQSNRPPP